MLDAVRRDGITQRSRVALSSVRGRGLRVCCGTGVVLCRHTEHCACLYGACELFARLC
jgi:hypothetical protein